ncbi:MAG: hypothetical protein Q7S43_01450 [bacterium]|nr:hypothetical protein [bacterium]
MIKRLSQSRFLIPILFMILSFVLYGNTLRESEFVYDDTFFSERLELRDPSHLKDIWLEPYVGYQSPGAYRPLTIFTISLNFIFGQSTMGFHLVNIILNGIITYLIFLVIFKLFSNKLLAIFTSLIFAFLPIHVEAVAFIKSRDELLASVFCLLAWLFFIKATGNKPVFKRSIVLSSVFLFLSILSKETFLINVLIFPAVYWFQKKDKFWPIFKMSLWYAPALSAYLSMRYIALGSYAFGKESVSFVANPLRDSDFFTRIWTACKIIFIGISKTFIPVNLSATYHYNQLKLIQNPFTSIETLIGVIFITFLIVFIVKDRTRKSPLGIGALIFFASYILVSKFLYKYGGEIFGERWMYFPSIGLSLIFGHFFSGIYKKGAAWSLTIFAIILSLYATVLIPRNLVWLSNKSLYENMIHTAPNSIVGYHGMANYYYHIKKLPEAMSYIESANKIYSDHPPLVNLQGLTATEIGNFELAEKSFFKAIELRPDLLISYLNLGSLYYGRGEYEKAEKYLIHSVRYVDPKDKSKFRILYALTLSNMGKYYESLDVLNQYLSDESEDPRVKFAFVINYYRLGDFVKLQRYIEVVPGNSNEERVEFLKKLN